MAVAAPERVERDLDRLVHRGADVRGFALGAARILGRAVPFDGVCVLTVDPATLLPTGEVVENGLPPSARSRLAEIEVGGHDVNTFVALARTPLRAASSSEATGGNLLRSVRHRELMEPHGFGDDLRAVLVSGSTAWGALTLLRSRARPHFCPQERDLVASVSGRLADGLRRAMLLGAVPAPDGVVGVAVLSAGNEIVSIDAAGRMWLAELGEAGDREPPRVVCAVAARARSIVAGCAPVGSAARVRVRTPTGRWLLLRGSTLGEGPDAPTAVIVEPARSHELAPLVADAYGLTERERAVTEFVARGLATAAVAARLHISPWTVQDHLKSIFEKVGVGTRGELTARVFLDHHGPLLTEDAPSG